MLNGLSALLSENSYPGRGIILGLDSAGSAVIGYFIMGRSENSRNRVFTEKDGGIITEAADPAKMKDPSLIIYAPVRIFGNDTIVTNGDQTDTVYNHLESGGSFEAAVRTRTFEPDDPNYTPRISGIVTRSGGFSYKLAILKSCGNNPVCLQRFFYEYPEPVNGQGHFISTYRFDGSPLPSFYGEPVPVAIDGDIDSFGGMLWNSLDAENKVSLFVRRITPDGECETRIYNKLSKI